MTHQDITEFFMKDAWHDQEQDILTYHWIFTQNFNGISPRIGSAVAYRLQDFSEFRKINVNPATSGYDSHIQQSVSAKFTEKNSFDERDQKQSGFNSLRFGKFRSKVNTFVQAISKLEISFILNAISDGHRPDILFCVMNVLH